MPARRALWMAVIVAAALAGVLGGPATAAWAATPCTATDSGVVDVSQTPRSSEGEESLSVDPANPAWLIAGANQVLEGGSANGLNVAPAWWSHDGGCTWHGGTPPDSGGADLGATLPLGGLSPEFAEVGNVLTADQHSAWDDHGNAYFSDIQVSGLRGGDQQIKVAHSGDGGVTWSSPVVAYSSETSPPPIGSIYAPGQVPLDRPWLAVDRSGGPRDGTVYVTWETSPFTPGLPPEVYAAASSDQGRTWSRAVRVDDGTYGTQFNPRQFPAVGADGALYVMYDLAPATVTPAPGLQLGTIQIAVARSTDGGRSFQRFIVDGDVRRVADPDEAAPEYSETIASLAADPAHPGHLAVIWPEAAGTANSRPMLRTSVDGGRTWTPRVDVADDPSTSNDQHDHVAASFTPDGRLVVEWRDRRHGGGSYDGAYDVWAREVTFSASGPTRLGPVVRLTAAPQPATTVQSADREGTLSEFLGLATSRSAVMTAFDQVVGSYTDAVFHRVALSTFTRPKGSAHRKRHRRRAARRRRRAHRHRRRRHHARFTG